MKTQIRKGVFETNSSSTHAICIGSTWTAPEKGTTIHFNGNDYGWETAEYNNVGDYLFTYALEEEYNTRGTIDKFMKKVEEYLAPFEVKVEYCGSEHYNIIDHYSGVKDFYDWAMESADNFYLCMFSDSRIYTGNDNSDFSIGWVRKNYNEWSGKAFWKSN